MFRVMKGVEEVGRVFLMNEILSCCNLRLNKSSTLWNGLFTYYIQGGMGYFKAGMYSGYFFGEKSDKLVIRGIKGGLTGVSMGVTGLLGRKLSERLYRM
ncbi:uncharacterized protein NESG_01269 [Nematocida ausubeli]|uniref:Uncharacterized protein n=1 Tax=Nematocida ausubeli (strain ATCC PRA-371 / ERTm2) TaxID=1913371 RepID=A0A086J1Y5_NEMA1|nr:uncharacterized protein NESG_01269 [Nematocida ausubeli]KFG26153.1 hypothetical protein NESG_01269 [Nematocida ausubeli]